MATSERKTASDTGYVLHSWPYRETSLVLDCLTREHGRLALIAKGAKRPHSALRGVLLSFHPLNLSWSGKAEVKNLTKAEWCGGTVFVPAARLLSAYYLNETLQALLPREDPHPTVFEAYVEALAALACCGNERDEAVALREFERRLLRELGYWPDLTVTAVQHEPVMPDRRYGVEPMLGVVWPESVAPDAPIYSGADLLAMAVGNWQSDTTLNAAKILFRRLLAAHLDGRPLRTRQVWIDLQKLQN